MDASIKALHYQTGKEVGIADYNVDILLVVVIVITELGMLQNAAHYPYTLCMQP